MRLRRGGRREGHGQRNWSDVFLRGRMELGHPGSEDGDNEELVISGWHFFPVLAVGDGAETRSRLPDRMEALTLTVSEKC